MLFIIISFSLPITKLFAGDRDEHNLLSESDNKSVDKNEVGLDRYNKNTSMVCI